jgi:hypothetical protein
MVRHRVCFRENGRERDRDIVYILERKSWLKSTAFVSDDLFVSFFLSVDKYSIYSTS